MIHRPSLESYFPNYLTEGAIFSYMNQAPWFDIEGVPLSLDVAYIGSYSGIKSASNLVRTHAGQPKPLGPFLAGILWTMYGNSWTRLWDAAKAEYTILDNYSMKEIYEMLGDDDRTIERSRKDASVSKDVTAGNNSTTSHGSADTSTYGFNSVTAVPTSTSENSNTDTTTESSTVDGTNTVDSTENSTDNLNRTENSTRTRTGNLGNISHQELLRQEFDLWKWHFYEQLFNDADKFLTLAVYDSCLF